MLNIIAVRIYYDDGTMTPKADLKFPDNTCQTIIWTNVSARNQFLPYMNGYTLFYDERSKVNWNN